jgi:hypothetical protein
LTRYHCQITGPTIHASTNYPRVYFVNLMTWRFIVFIESRNSCLFGIKKLIICTHNLVIITAALIIKINKWHPYQIPCGAKINHQSLAVLHSQCVIKKIHGKFVSKLQGILFIFSEKKISKNHSKSKLSLRAVDISKEFEMRLYSPRFNIPSALEGLHFHYSSTAFESST